ncbi:MAG: hypothetical protein M1504_00180 [Candidatus Marsarchaeota archaeon]|nr:hypothetical protein [Candidatus Marsarchaeota archaeon]
MMKRLSNNDRKRRLENMLESLKEGVVVVEGIHDVAALKKLDIDAITYSKFMSGNGHTEALYGDRTIYILMDADNGGEDKESKVLQLLDMMDTTMAHDTELGKRLLKLLGITSIEQIYGKARSVLDNGD